MTINFFKGHPTRPLLPTKHIAAAYQRVLLDSDYLAYDNDPLNQHPLTYGTDPGNYDVRKSISAWNNRVFATDKSHPDNINLTGGASYGIANILSSTTAPEITKRAFVVSPTYFLINSVFVDVGLGDKLTAVKETPGARHQIDLQYLESQLEHYSQGLESGAREINIIKDPLRPDRKLYRFVIYLVPTFSNPGGLTYSEETRTKLIELARRHDMLIISDDVYELLDYTGGSAPPVARLNYLDAASLPEYKKFGNTISNATFSKIIAPGLRVGWQEAATPLLVQQLAVTGANKSGGTPGQLASLVVKDLIDKGILDTIVEDFKTVYSARARVLKHSLRYLPQSTKLYGGDGGYFVWIEIDGGEGFDHAKVVRLLQEKHDVVLAGGEHFEVVGDPKNWGRTSVRLSLSFLSEEQIEEGIKRWGQVLKEEYPKLYE